MLQYTIMDIFALFLTGAKQICYFACSHSPF